MKQSSSTTTSRTTRDNNNIHNSTLSIFDYHDDDDDDDYDVEIRVAEILLQLSNQASLEFRFPYTWGRKRRRSAIDLTPPPPPHLLLKTYEQQEDEDDEERRLLSFQRKEIKASSPATPLSFSPSESDDKSKNSSKITIISKKTKEELLQDVSKLTETRESLKGEVEIVRNYYDKLKALNLELKARKKKLSICHEKERQYTETNKGLNLAMELAQPQVRIPSPTVGIQEHRHPNPTNSVFQDQSQPFITVDQTVRKSVICKELQYPFAHLNGLGMNINHMGPPGIPDLNLSVEETHTHDMECFPPLDQMGRGVIISPTNSNKVMAAQARKKRMQIYKVKFSAAAIKARHGHR